MTGHRKEKGFSLIEVMIVVVIALVITAMAVPAFIATRRNFRATGDARDVAAEILLAKMRAASDFTQTRAYFDTSAQTFRLEIWDKAGASATCAGTPCWVIDSPTGTYNLAQGIAFPTSFGAVTTAPGGTAITQAPACLNDSGTPGTGSAITNTACVVFNSRGVPIDSTGAAIGSDAIYITDLTAFYGVTISATGLIRQYRTDEGAANWQQR